MVWSLLHQCTCMHGPASLAACCSIVRSPFWWQWFILSRGAEVNSAIDGITSFRRTGVIVAAQYFNCFRFGCCATEACVKVTKWESATESELCSNRVASRQHQCTCAWPGQSFAIHRGRLESCEIVEYKNNAEQRQIAWNRLVGASVFCTIRIESRRAWRVHGFGFGSEKGHCRIERRETFAVLSPANIDAKGEEVHVLVEDPLGRWQTRRRFLFQLCSGHVTYMDGKPKKSFTPDSVKVVLSYAKQHTEAEAWSCVVKNAQDLTKKWLQLRAKVEYLDVRPPTRITRLPDMLQVIVFLPISSWTSVLRASGMDGVFV